eukprot:gene16971-23308_t
MNDFRARVAESISRVQQLLQDHKLTGTNSTSTLENVSHHYDDKYILSEMLTRTMVASILNTLWFLDLNISNAVVINNWRIDGKAITLQLKASSNCAFLKETKRDVVDNQRIETERSISSLMKEKITTKVVTTVTEYEYEYKVDYELLCYA